MTRYLTLILSASALALGACGYSGQDEPHESGAERLPETEPPVDARETSPHSPQAGETETEMPQGEREGEPGAEEDTSEDEPG